MRYKKWLLSEEENDLGYYRNIILSKLDLDREGLNQSLAVWDSDKLIKKLNELGEYVKLPELKRRSIESQIKSKIGTVNDLIRFIAS